MARRWWAAFDSAPARNASRRHPERSSTCAPHSQVTLITADCHRTGALVHAVHRRQSLPEAERGGDVRRRSMLCGPARLHEPIQRASGAPVSGPAGAPALERERPTTLDGRMVIASLPHARRDFSPSVCWSRASSCPVAPSTFGAPPRAQSGNSRTTIIQSCRTLPSH